ncbi:uncharacterized protein B0T15DRAFT_536670 [Chaetomium strumarium]|uniref:C2H2-type domain-containing protein n=1 Tax=Chaetomium strumarium TaxID=1170767 RepID=A0AAJ0GQX2_9PEZI|nr:hypothetical protein B0T15DRAFT_536670 [Chaetomium strumarium]
MAYIAPTQHHDGQLSQLEEWSLPSLSGCEPEWSEPSLFDAHVWYHEPSALSTPSTLTLSPPDQYLDANPAFSPPGEYLDVTPAPTTIPAFPPQGQAAYQGPTWQHGPFTHATPNALSQQAAFQFGSNVPVASGSGLTPLTPMSHRSPTGSVEATNPGPSTANLYTCTYGGCPRRFMTKQDLQVHKKTEHQQHHRSGARGSNAREAGMSQSGPHVCYETNPVTGENCLTSFSRPYDLTRHQHTVHARKEKATCEICGRWFSRGDALSRHRKHQHTDKYPGLAEKNARRRKRDANG